MKASFKLAKERGIHLCFSSEIPHFTIDLVLRLLSISESNMSPIFQMIM
jgi:hypothetical protein